MSGVDPDARARTAAKLTAVADDPAWPAVLRIEAKVANYDEIVLADLSDDAVREALTERIAQRAGHRSGGGTDHIERLRERLEELRARGSMTRPIPWRMRWAAAWAALVQLATGRHVYIATSCLHGDCSHCRSGRRLDGGPKRPMCCKWCETPCRCPGCPR